MEISETGSYTLSEVIERLKQEGYTEDFNLPQPCAEFRDNPEQFVIEKTFRFDNQSDPDDQCVLYAVCCQKRNIKGILLNSFGIYADAAVTHIIDEVKVDYSKGTSLKLPIIGESPQI